MEWDNETHISEVEQSTSIFVSVSQIYNENINDMLISNCANLKCRQDRSGTFYVENLTQVEVKSAKDIFKLIKKAN